MGTQDDDRNDDRTLALIEEQAEERIRRAWHDERWFFSVVDVVGILTDSPNPGAYWRKLKQRLREDEGAHETVTNCHTLRMTAADGKQRQTDAADTATLLRIIQSVPSPKAEPVKRWLAKIGAQHLEPITQPLPPANLASERGALTQPAEWAPALEWAEYHEQLAALYRRQAAYEARMRLIDTTLAQHEIDITELHARLESADEVLRLVPEILERLGPETLTSEHQRTVQSAVKRLHEAGGYAYATIYGELGTHFHVAKYEQIPEARWDEVAEWFRVRIVMAEGRHGR